MRISSRTILLIATFFLTACGGSGGDNDGGTSSSSDTSISGQAFDAELANATIQVSTLGGQLLATSQTDATGKFTLAISGQTAQVLKFVASQGSYYEQAGGEHIFLNYETLISYVYYTPAQTLFVPINLLSHMAAGFFEYQIEQQGQGADLAAVQAAVSQYADFSVEDTSMLNLAHPIETAQFGAQEKASLFSAGVSQFMYDAAGNQSGSFYTSIAFTQLIYQDAKYDGILNGITSYGTAGIGTLTFSTNTYRDGLAFAMIEFVNSSSNASNLTVPDMYDFASELSAVTGLSILGPEASNPISNTLPTISNANPSSNQPVYGQTEFSFDVVDFAGIQSISFKFSNGQEQFTTDFENPLFSVDTTPFLDGAHDVVITAKNISDQVATETYQVIVSNNGTTISNLNPAQGQVVRANHLFSVDASDGAGVASGAFYINSELHNDLTAIAGGYTKNIDTTDYSDGNYTFKVEVTNSLSIETDKETSFIIDNTEPTLSDLGFANGDFLTGTVNINPTLTDANGIATASLYLDSELLSSTLHQSSFDMETDLYSEGDHTIKVVSTDTAGNIGTVETSIAVDNQPPSVNIWYPSDGVTVTTSFTLRWDQEDANGWGSTPASLYVGGIFYAEIENHFEQRSININNRPRGNNDIEVIVTDASGKTSSHSITVNFQP